MMPADANDSGSHDRSAAESGRKPPRPSSKTSTGSWPSISTPPLQSSSWRRRFPDRSSSTRPRCCKPRRSVSSDASRSDPSANSWAIRHQVSGVWTNCDRSVASLSPQQLGRLSRRTTTCRRRTATCAREQMASTAFRRATSWPLSSAGRRSSTLRLSRRPAAISHALSQQPGSAVENGDGAARPHVEPGRIDHQRRRAVTTQESSPREMDRLAAASALAEARRLHTLQALQGRQRLSPGVTGQRSSEGLRRRHDPRQGGGARVEPRRQLREVAHGVPLSDGSATMARA